MSSTNTIAAYGLIGVGTLKRAHAGSRLDIDIDGAIPMAFIKAANGLWSWEIGGVAGEAKHDTDYIQAYIRKQHCGHTFTGAVNPAEYDKTLCRRCGGIGHIPQYAHIDGGRCYDCSGTGRSAQTA